MGVDLLTIQLARRFEQAEDPYFQLIIVHILALGRASLRIEERSVPEFQGIFADSMFGDE